LSPFRTNSEQRFTYFKYDKPACLQYAVIVPLNES